jgi:diphthamide synthase (EF-2-diphthine--ammonia ligase)
MHRDAVVRLLAALEADDVEYVLVGGVAVNPHGIVRATEDVDLFVRPDEDNVSRLRAALRRLHDDAEIATITAADLAGEFDASDAERLRAAFGLEER